MNIKTLYTPDIYRKIMAADKSRKNDIYRYEMMMPYKGKWDCYHIPIKAETPGGYDIIMANNMLGLMPPDEIDGSFKEAIEMLSDSVLWEESKNAIAKALERFEKSGIELKEEEYLFSIFLANPKNAYTIMNEGYCGDGGIPGYIMAWLVPTEETIRRLPAALVHETNHNVRYQYIKWTNDINLGEMLVSEGLAENYATALFGEEFLGPWVSKTDKELIPLIKEIIHDGLGAQGLDNITAYLYGDEMAEMQNYPKVGLPYCAGYAMGYYMVKYYLEKTKVPIERATVLPAEEILSQVEDFWKG